MRVRLAFLLCLCLLAALGLAALGHSLATGVEARAEAAAREELRLLADRWALALEGAIDAALAELSAGRAPYLIERGAVVLPPPPRALESLFAKDTIEQLSAEDPPGAGLLARAESALIARDFSAAETALRAATVTARPRAIRLRGEFLLSALYAQRDMPVEAGLHAARAFAILKDAEPRTREGLMLRARFAPEDPALPSDLAAGLGGPMDAFVRLMLERLGPHTAEVVAARLTALEMRARLECSLPFEPEATRGVLRFGDERLLWRRLEGRAELFPLQVPAWPHNLSLEEENNAERFAVARRQIYPLDLGLTLSARLPLEEIAARGRDEATTYGLFFALLSTGVAATFLILTASLLRERRATRERARLLAHLGHELRTPVASLRLYADTLAAGRAQGEERESFVRTIAEEARRVSEALDKALSFGRSEAAKEGKERLDMTALVAEVATDLGVFARECGVRLEGKGEPDLFLLAPRVALRNAIICLLENALHHGASGGVVRWTTSREGTAALALSIEDAGPGWPEELGDQVFRPFVRGKGAKGRGIGLGLALVKGLAQDLGGSCRRGTSDLGGALVRLVLPRAESPE